MSKDVQVPDGRVLLVGLGNPGVEYARTRHNIGFLALELLARRWSIPLGEKKFRGVIGAGTVAGRSAVLLEPQTYMNLSGESVQPAAAFFKIPTSGVIVLHDDLDLPPGRVRIKVGGGHAGHNGLRSIDARMGDSSYFRVRLGIGRPTGAESVSSWVLGRFGASEEADCARAVDLGADAVESILREGLLATQGRIHPLS